MWKVKPRTSRTKQRADERERRFFKDDIEQPYDNFGRKNPRFAKLYGDSIYDKVDKLK